MKIKNQEILGFMNFLMSFELKGKESRLRTRFTRLLGEYQNRFDDEHKDLIKQFSNLDEKGNPIVIDDNGVQKYDVKDIIGFNKEYYVLRLEEVIIEETEERQEMLNLIKEIILECDMTFKGEEALLYDRYCEIVETIKYN